MSIDLTHPNDTDDEIDEYDHSFNTKVVEQAHRMANPDIPVEELHEHLETVQESLENELTRGKWIGMYDPLGLFGVVGHAIRRPQTDRYDRILCLEDGYYGFDSEEHRKHAIASQHAYDEMTDDDDEMGDDFDVDAYQERTNDLVEEIDLSEYTEDEQKEAFGLKYDIWEAVAEMLSLDVDGNNTDRGVLDAIKMTHELTYDSNATHTKHGVTGFVVGLPPMFIAGMHGEQRFFSAFAGSKMSTAELVDSYGNRVSYKDDGKWGSKRGVSASSVNQNRSKAHQVLQDKYEDGTYPLGLIE